MADFTGFFAAYSGTPNGSGLNPLIEEIEGAVTLTSADGDFDVGESFDIDVDLEPPTVPFPVTVNLTFRFEGIIEQGGVQFPVFFTDDPDIIALYPDGVYVVGVSQDVTPLPTVPLELDIPGSLQVQDFIICFLAGTGIATPTGGVAIETLSIGDPVLTADGRTVAVKWVGRQTVSTRFGAPDRLRPVRIATGALGDGLPRRDLCLTADHALLIDGLLVNAGALVNGTTITREPLDRFDGSYTAYHVETANHELILAEGAPAETFVDYVGRKAFDNHAEYLALYGAEPALPEMAQPRITAAHHLPPALRARLGIDRAA